MKRKLLNAIRKVHLAFSSHRLPDRIAVYFHEIEAADRGRFQEAISYLLAQGYMCVDAAGYLADAGPKRRLFISFDDNFVDWFEALDILEELGATATFYVTSGVFRDRSTLDEQRNFMATINQPEERQTLTVAQLREIHARGHTIGCHTHTHPVLSRLPRDAWVREISHSRKVLERLINAPVLDFSFPFGMRRDFSPELADFCRREGFRSIATGMSGLLVSSRRNPWKLHRTGWKFELPLSENLKNLCIDGRIYAAITGRSVIG